MCIGGRFTTCVQTWLPRWQITIATLPFLNSGRRCPRQRRKQRIAVRRRKRKRRKKEANKKRKRKRNWRPRLAKRIQDFYDLMKAIVRQAHNAFANRIVRLSHGRQPSDQHLRCRRLA